MADQIEILASGVQANVGAVMNGVTRMLAGYKSGTVAFEDQVKSTPVDVSDYTTLRLTLTVSAMSNRHGFENGLPFAAELRVALERQVGGGWEVAHVFAPVKNPQQQSVVLSADRFLNPASLADGQLRASWFWARHGNPESTILDEVTFTFGISGEALPEAAE